MGRYQKTAIDLTHRFAFLPLIFFLAGVSSFAQTDSLKLIITLEQPVITAPFPARVTLHLHNSGKETLWLYRRALASRPAAGQPGSGAPQTAFVGASHSVEGPTLAVRLESADNKVTSPGTGEVLDYVGLPHPKLIRLAAGDDYEEKTVVRLTPASVEASGEKRPLWGRYKFAVTYVAKYSNAEELERILGVTIWHGQVESNSIEVELQPPTPAAQGSIAGSVVGPDNVPRMDALVSLSDQEERLLNQAFTDSEGRFSFTHLPLGLYWATVRRKDSTEDTVVFRHLVLTAAEPAGTPEFLLPTPETFEPKQMLHKPVLFRVVDRAGAPLGNITIEITWSTGTVLDNVKGRTSDDGTAPVELIPGRNYVTLKRSKCPKDDERLDVTPGPGIDGFKMVFDCSKK